jgi:hypothetical protein
MNRVSGAGKSGTWRDLAVWESLFYIYPYGKGGKFRCSTKENISKQGVKSVAKVFFFASLAVLAVERFFLCELCALPVPLAPSGL